MPRLDGSKKNLENPQSCSSVKSASTQTGRSGDVQSQTIHNQHRHRFESIQGNLGNAFKLRSNPDQECDRVNDSEIWQDGGDAVSSLKKVAITRYEVLGVTVGGQIEVRFVLWVARQSDTGSDFIHTDCNSFNSSDEFGNYVIRQL